MVPDINWKKSNFCGNGQNWQVLLVFEWKIGCVITTFTLLNFSTLKVLKISSKDRQSNTNFLPCKACLSTIQSKLVESERDN